MHNRRVGRDIFTVEVCSKYRVSFDTNSFKWAKNTPSSSWRFDGGRDRPQRDMDRGYDRDRGSSDRDYPRRDPPRRRSPGDRPSRVGDVSPRRDERNGRRGRSYSRSPPPRGSPARRADRERSRSPKVSDRRGDRDRDERDDRDDRDDLRDVRNNGDDLGTLTLLKTDSDFQDKYDDKDLVED